MSITLLARDLYGIGAHQSNAIPWQPGASGVAIQADLSAADLADPSISGWLYAEISQDNQQTWTLSSTEFQGGTLRAGSDTELQVPEIDISQNGLITHVRMRFELPAQLSIGATATFF